MAATYDFRPFQKIVGVGGGHGALKTAILAKYPNLSALIADLPEVLEGTRKRLIPTGTPSSIIEAVTA